MIGWRKATLAQLRTAWKDYATELSRELREDQGKEAQRVREELWLTARRVKGLGGWLGTYDTKESLLERYPAMRPFVCGYEDAVRRPWREGARMPKAVEKWLPMVSIWATEQERGRAKPARRTTIAYYSSGEEFPSATTEWMVEMPKSKSVLRGL